MTPPTHADGSPASAGRLSPGWFGLWLLAGLAIAFPSVMGGWEAFFYRDHGVLAYPGIYHYQGSVWNGEFPLWNPLSNCGAPFAAQWGPMVYYPGMIFCLVLPLPWALGVFCLAHLWLAGMGMYYLARRWTHDDFAAAAAGTMFVFNGAMFSCLLWPNYTVALGWMPWVVLLMDKAWTQGGRHIWLAGLVAAAQLLSGVPELVLLTWAAVLTLLGVAVVAEPTQRWRMLARAALVPLLATGLAAVQILPFLDLLSHSHRTPGFTATKWMMPTWGLGHYIVPLFHCFETPEGLFFQYGQAFLSSYYAGVVTLVLGVWGLRWARARQTTALAILAAFCLVMAMGEAGYLYAWVKAVFPALGIARFPVKFVLLPAFILPLLAAWGIAKVVNSTEPAVIKAAPVRSLWSIMIVMGLVILIVALAQRNRLTYDQPNVTATNGVVRLIFLAFTLGLLLVVNHLRWGNLARLAFLGVFVGDILTHAPRQNPTLPARLPDMPVGLFAPGFWQLDQTAAPPRAGEGRVFITPGAEGRLLNSDIKALQAQWIGKRLAQWSHLNLIDQIPKVNGSSTLQLQAERVIEDQIYKVPTNATPEPLLDFLGAQYMTPPGKAIGWTNRPTALPIITAGQRPEFLSPTNIVLSLFANAFQPREVVYLPEALRGQVTATNRVNATITDLAFKANEIRFTVATPAPCLVVVAQSHHPNWRVEVDGERRPLWVANYAFQAFEAGAGKQAVRLVYVDRHFQVGLSLSLVTLAVTLLALLTRRRNLT